MYSILAICLISLPIGTTPSPTIARHDSIPGSAQPGMPIVRPRNELYRDPHDPKRVTRATLDNMPARQPDTSVIYLIQKNVPGYKPRLELLPKP